MKGEPVIVVTGLPRSGTTCMMRMLEAGGVQPYYDTDRPLEFKENGKDYVNYNIILRETDKINDLKEGNGSWLDECRGKSVKILTPTKVIIPKGRNYKFIYMDRKIKHMMKSQKKYSHRAQIHEFPDDVHPSVIEGYTRLTRSQGVEMLKKYPNSSMIIIKFEEVLKNAYAVARKVTKFLHQDLDVEAMSEVVVKRPAHCLKGMLEESIYV